MEAVEAAKTYVIELFGEDGLAGLRLEEIELDEEGFWNVTIGFVRPLALAGAETRVGHLLAKLDGEPLGPRVYRVVKIRDQDGEVLSVKFREGLD